MAYLTSLDDVTQAVYTRIKAAQGSLAVRQVYYADNNFVPQYPNVVVAHGRKGKARHTTGNRFLFTFTVFVYVLHSDMNLTKAMRTKADVQLAEAVSNVLESDFTLGGQVIEGFTESIEPAMLPGQRKGDGVVSSRITFYATSVG